MTIGARLKQWRLHKHLKQDEISSLLGIPFSTYQKYEMAISKPGADAMEAFSRAGINVNWLLTGEGEMMYTSILLPSLGDLYSLDKDRLRTAIETVEEILLESGKIMAPAKKAEAIALAYDIFEEEDGEEVQAITKKILAKLVKSLA